MPELYCSIRSLWVTFFAPPHLHNGYCETLPLMHVIKRFEITKNYREKFPHHVIMFIIAWFILARSV